MPRRNKVKRYSSIYSKSKRGRSLAFQITMSIIAFVVIAVIVYLVAVGVTSYMNREPYNELESSTPSVAPESSALVTEKQQENQEKIMVAQMSASSMTSKSYVTEFIKKAKDEGKNAVIVPLKTEEGTILYSTKVSEAKSWGAISNSVVNAASISAEIEVAGLTPIAQVSAFYDQTAPHAKRGNSYYHNSQKTTTHLFKNATTGKSERWLNPYEEVTRKYICDIVAEIGTLGYKHVVVDDVAFPGTEFDSTVGTDAAGKSKSDILKTFIKELDSTGISTIISYDWDALGGSKATDIVYGGDISTYGIKNQAPIIDMSSTPTGLSSKDEPIKDMVEYIKGIGSEILIVPEIPADQDFKTITDELKSSNVYSNILLAKS